MVVVARSQSSAEVDGLEQRVAARGQLLVGEAPVRGEALVEELQLGQWLHPAGHVQVACALALRGLR